VALGAALAQALTTLAPVKLNQRLLDTAKFTIGHDVPSQPLARCRQQQRQKGTSLTVRTWSPAEVLRRVLRRDPEEELRADQQNDSKVSACCAFG